MRGRRVVLLSACLLVGASACRREAPAENINLDTTTEPAIPRIGPAVPATSRPVAAAPGWIDPMQPPPRDVRAPMVRVEEGPLTATDTVAVPPASAPPPRDLSAELRALAGDVTGCIPVAAVTGRPQVIVELEATVIENGALSRLAVRGAGLPPQATDCIRARLELARLSAPVPDAPRAVQSRIVLDLQPVPAAATAAEFDTVPAQPLVIQQRVR